MKKMLILLSLVFGLLPVLSLVNTSLLGGITGPLQFSMPVNGTAGVRVGYDITDVVGINGESNVWFGSHGISDSKAVARAVGLGLNGTINLIPYKKFSVIPEAGLHWVHHYKSTYISNDDLVAKTGVIFRYKPNKFSFFVEPLIWWDLNDHVYGDITFNKNNAQLGLQIGITYHFNRGSYVSRKVDRYKQQSDFLLYTLINLLPKQITVKDTTIVYNETVINLTIVFFSQNSSTITDYSGLDKIEPGTEVEVHGYASPEGTMEYNLTLSQARAEKVAHYLIYKGVKVTKCIGHGAENETSNRVVLVY